MMQMNKYRYPKKCCHGFTLIEVMIAVAIVGTLAAIAIPSYAQYVRRADRAQTQADLYEMAQIAERGFSEQKTYTGTIPMAAGGFDNQYYNFTFTVTGAGGSGYTIMAVTTANARDMFDLRLDSVGNETFRATGTVPWSGIGWDNI